MVDLPLHNVLLQFLQRKVGFPYFPSSDPKKYTTQHHPTSQSTSNIIFVNEAKMKKEE
jgi:hypothetical protein